MLLYLLHHASDSLFALTVCTHILHIWHINVHTHTRKDLYMPRTNCALPVSLHRRPYKTNSITPAAYMIDNELYTPTIFFLSSKNLPFIFVLLALSRNSGTCLQDVSCCHFLTICTVYPFLCYVSCCSVRGNGNNDVKPIVIDVIY